MQPGARVVSSTSVLVVLGCAQVLDIEETTLQQPKADDDGAEPEPDAGDDGMARVDAGPPTPGEDYRCLGTDWLDEAEENRIEILARIVEIDTGDPVVGLQVRVCRSRLDIDCSGTQVASDDAGLARVEVDKGFNGYLRIEGPDESGVERVGYLWYFSQPLVNSYVFPIFAMTPQFRQDVIYGGVLGSDIEYNPERGDIAINVTDCSDAPAADVIEGETVLSAPGLNAPGVHFSITDADRVDDETRQFYFAGGNPAWPTDEDDQVTDETGLGGFLNVQPGPIPIAAVPRSLGRASASDVLLVRAGFLTTVRLLPE